MNPHKADFPILQRMIGKHRLVYLDNAATTQKPRSVLQAIVDYYEQSNANVHRAAHALADEATTAFENARETVRAFINAQRREEIIWTRGTTESINLVAAVLKSRIQSGDEILITSLEHHANIVPWQLLAEATGSRLKVLPLNENGEIDDSQLDAALTDRTRIFAMSQVSNALGTINPVRRWIAQAKARNILTLVDGAQAVAHEPVDVQALQCDFYAFSSHKMYGPMGIGVLYGRYQLLAELPPYQAGGEMIRTVDWSSSTYQSPPYRFEAGTPNVEGAIGLAAAIRYLDSRDRRQIAAVENSLAVRLEAQLKQFPGVRIVGAANNKAPLVSFVMDGAHPHDLATLLDQQGIAVRSGHHCAMPLMNRLGLSGTVRASFALYNDEQDVEDFVAAFRRVQALI